MPLNKKCQSCGLINIATETVCRRCGLHLLSDAEISKQKVRLAARKILFSTLIGVGVGVALALLTISTMGHAGSLLLPLFYPCIFLVQVTASPIFPREAGFGNILDRLAIITALIQYPLYGLFIGVMRAKGYDKTGITILAIIHFLLLALMFLQ